MALPSKATLLAQYEAALAAEGIQLDPAQAAAIKKFLKAIADITHDFVSAGTAGGDPVI